MPKPKREPSYRLHKARGLAVVVIDGKSIYLGEFNSPESVQKYNAKIAEWRRKQSVRSEPTETTRAIFTCGDFALDYLAYAERYYVKNNQPTSQVHQVKQALKALVALYETLPAAEFGPTKLKNVRQHLVSQGKTRSYVNKLTTCLKTALKWGVSEELLPAAAHQALLSVGQLKKGRTEAPETDGVKPVDEAIVNQTLPHLSGVVADMIRVQLLTGMRPGEIIQLRPRDLDRRPAGAWEYRPESHKTEHHDKERCVFIGPQAQEILRPYLEGGAGGDFIRLRDAEAYCFSPAESRAQYYAARSAQRKSRITPSQQSRKPKAKPKRAPSGRYTTSSYRRAIERACEAAFEMPAWLKKPPRDADGKPLPESPADRLERSRLAAEWRQAHCWSPNHLRHTKGTQIREQFGLESAQVVLGHANAKVTEIYAEKNRKKAAEVMQRIG